MASLPQMVYICSAGHSGSTLLDILLGANSNIESLGEITQLPKNIALNTQCCCGDMLDECVFWNEVLNRLDKRLNKSIRNDPYSLNLGFIHAVTVVDHKHQNRWQVLERKLAHAASFFSYRYNLPKLGLVESKFREAIANKWALYEEVAAVSGKSHVVDSSKHYLEAVKLHQKSPANTKIILLIRDGRAVFNSGLKMGLGEKKALGAWLDTYQRALPLLDKYVPSTDVLTVHYESLAKEPEATMRGICDFVGLEFQDSMVDLSASNNHIANGNNMRFEKGASIRYDDSWLKALSGEQLDFFEKHAGSMNARLGYV